MNVLEEIKRLRKVIGTRCPLDQSEAYMLCDALEEAIETLVEVREMKTKQPAEFLLKEWGVIG